MTSVYNLLREACGISQAEAAEHVHETRLDTVKSWSSDRRPAPQWAINQLQSLSRRIRRAGDIYAKHLKALRPLAPSITIPVPRDEDARKRGFPSTAAMMQAIAIAVSLLPDDVEVDLRQLHAPLSDGIVLPQLEPDQVMPTRTDRQVLMSMNFRNGEHYTAGNMNRRKFERLEDIGWLKHYCPNVSDVVYTITEAGKKARRSIAALVEHPDD
jgi:hypothetical protein